MTDQSVLREALKALLSHQRLAVLATQDLGQPYTNLVAFVASGDLKELLFATTRSTRKYANLLAEARVAMLVDNRSNEVADFAHAMAATATGRVEEVAGPEKEEALRTYLSKHPYLQGFVSAPTCALLRIRVDCYYVVSRFQSVTELHVKEE